MYTICWLLLLNLLLVNNNIAGDIYQQTIFVSDESGHDVKGCGYTVNTACHTVQQFFKESTTHPMLNLTILIHGGNNNRSIYIYRSTIEIPEQIIGITLKSYGRYRPIVHCAPLSSVQVIPLFQNLKQTSYLHITNIDFKNLYPARFSTDTRKYVMISIWNSLWKFEEWKSRTFIGSYADNLPISKLFLLMEHVKLIGNSVGIPILPSSNEGNWNIRVRNCSFVSTGFIIIVGNKNSGSVIIDNSTFSGEVFHDSYFDINGFSEIKLSSIVTNSMEAGEARSNGLMIKIKNTKFASIQHSIFTNLTNNGIVVQVMETDVFNFSNNRASYIVGQLLDLVGSFRVITVYNSIFDHITSGTLVINSVGIIKIKNSSFEYVNSAISIYYSAYECQISNNVFKHCYTERYCGAIYITIALPATPNIMRITQCIFEENRAESEGGALYSENTNIEISDSIFYKNSATSSGTVSFGGSESKLTLTNVNITSPEKHEKLPIFATIMNFKSKNINDDWFEIYRSNIYILSSNGYIDVLATSFSQSSTFSLFCPLRSSVNLMRTKSLTKISCKFCGKGKYTFQAGSLRYSKGEAVLQNITCENCPFGGDCQGDDDIKSVKHFWGYDFNSQITFVQCPPNYCCSTDKECIGINSCGKNREGNICGVCKAGHFVNFFNDRCIPNDRCIHNGAFWVIYLTGIFLAFIALAWLSDFGQLVKKCCCKSPDPSQELLVDETTTSNILSGFLKTLINFYQINLMISVPHVSSEPSNLNVISQILPSIFNLKITVKKFSTEFCPSKNLNIIDKLFMTNILPVLMLLMTGVILIFVNHLSQRFFRCPHDDSNFTDEANMFQEEQQSDTLDNTYKNENIEANQQVDIEDSRNTISKVQAEEFGTLVCYQNVDNDAECIHICQEMEEKEEEKHQSQLYRMPLDVRCKVFIIRLMLIMYTNIISYIMLMTNVFHLPTGPVLLISGETSFYNYKTYICILSFFLFALAFPVNTYVVTKWLQDRKIPNNWFVICFTFPPFTVLFYFHTKCTKRGAKKDSERNEHETKSSLSVLEEPFRKGTSTQKPIIWDHVILFRRFLIAVCNIYIKNYVVRLAVTIPVLVLMCLHHSRRSPYKARILNNTETLCFFILSFNATANLFWAFFYVYSLGYQPPMSILGETLKYIEFILTLVPFIIMVLFCLRGLFKFCFWKIPEKCL